MGKVLLMPQAEQRAASTKAHNQTSKHIVAAVRVFGANGLRNSSSISLGAL